LFPNTTAFAERGEPSTASNFVAGVSIAAYNLAAPAIKFQAFISNPLSPVGRELPLYVQPTDDQLEGAAAFEIATSFVPAGTVRGIASKLAARLQLLGKSVRPQVIAVLRTPTGRIVVGTNRNRVSNARVQEVLSYIIPNQFLGRCAEVSCISRALNKGIDIEGSTIEVLEVRGLGNPKSGLPKQFCDVCDALTRFFGVTRE
jgi:hypothetical protein